MTKWLVLAGLAGFGYTRLRYYGFRPEPLPEKPRTVATPPLPTVRED